jgi:hypothetical protein
LPGSNVSHDKFYDQIAFYQRTEGLTCTQASVFDFYEYVYNDEALYKKYSEPTNARNFREWRTYQMSDHLIMWAQFDVDKTAIYLDAVTQETFPPEDGAPKKKSTARRSSKRAKK